MNNRPKVLSWCGIVLILIIGLIHVVDARPSFEDAVYKGWLFYANGLGALISAFGIYRRKRTWGWNLGVFIATGSLLGYIISRTIGLPLIPAEPDAWLEPLGVASLIAETMFIGLFLKRNFIRDK